MQILPLWLSFFAAYESGRTTNWSDFSLKGSLHVFRVVGTTVAPIPSITSKVRGFTKAQDAGPNKRAAFLNTFSHLNRDAPCCASCWAVCASKVTVIRSPVDEKKAVVVVGVVVARLVANVVVDAVVDVVVIVVAGFSGWSVGERLFGYLV